MKFLTCLFIGHNWQWLRRTGLAGRRNVKVCARCGTDSY